MNEYKFTDVLNELLYNFNDTVVPERDNGLWERFRNSGTELWLDTGDIEAAKKLWNKNFTALTTNNTLLNKEIQKGIYDDLIKEAARFYNKNDIKETVKDIALVLNALHGLRLVRIFNAKVSVELHTDLAHDIDGIEFFGTKLYNVDPEHFIIKVPFTAAGLIGARKLHDKGIPVNFTLMFSARQNILAAVIAKPAYSNVFLGRIGAFLNDNGLGKPDFIGEKVTIKTQSYLKELRRNDPFHTRLIAASIRNREQLLMMKNTDVFTIPVTVTEDTVNNLGTNSEIPFKEPGDIELFYKDDLINSQINKLMEVDDHVFEIGKEFSENIPSSETELTDFAKDRGGEDIFPELNTEDERTIISDGKIPVYKHWKEQITHNKTAVDSLLNLAGLYAFKKDQAALDNRIKEKLKE
jgi:transaldolase